MVIFTYRQDDEMKSNVRKLNWSSKDKRTNGQLEDAK